MGFTANQWAIVALVLVLGWLLGLLSRSGGGRWKREARAERAERERIGARLAIANARIAELERARPVAATTTAPLAATAPGDHDDLTLIRGIDAEQAARLREAGVHGYRDLAALDDTDVATTETRLGLAPRTIVGEHWREQAATLRDEGVEAHRARYL